MKVCGAPALTCDAVLTEAAYFLREDRADVEPLFKLIERKALSLDFDLSVHWPRVRALMKRWEQMDLADACVVVMSELHARGQVLTLDRNDFSIYRRNDRHVINFVAPPPK